MSDFSYSTSPSFNEYLNRINAMRAPEAQTTTFTPAAPVSLEQKPDVAEFSAKKEYDGPKIGFLRTAFGRLTDEQIEAINRTRRVPQNLKFNQFKALKYNFFNITAGTRTVPEGYELRKNKFGFTKLVLIDSEGLFLKKKPGGDAEARIEAKKEAKEAKKAAKYRKKGILID